MKFIDLVIMPTSRCNRGCWFCECSSVPEGQDLDIDRFWRLKELLFSSPIWDQYQVENVLITGGGEPLLYDKFPQLVTGSALFEPLHISILTSGPEDDDGEKDRLKELLIRLNNAQDGKVELDDGSVLEIAPVKPNLQFSLHNNPKAFARLKRLIEAGVRSVKVLYRQDRRQSGPAKLKEWCDFWNWLESLGFAKVYSCHRDSEPYVVDFVRSFLYKEYSDEFLAERDEAIEILEELATVNTWLNLKGQTIFQCDFDNISANGRGWEHMKHLPGLKRPWEYGLCKFLKHPKDTVELTMDWNGRLGLCACGNIWADVEDLPQLLAEYDQTRSSILRALLDTSINYANACTVCPIRSQRKVPIICPC